MLVKVRVVRAVNLLLMTTVTEGVYKLTANLLLESNSTTAHLCLLIARPAMIKLSTNPSLMIPPQCRQLRRLTSASAVYGCRVCFITSGLRAALSLLTISFALDLSLPALNPRPRCPLLHRGWPSSPRTTHPCSFDGEKSCISPSSIDGTRFRARGDRDRDMTGNDYTLAPHHSMASCPLSALREVAGCY